MQGLGLLDLGRIVLTFVAQTFAHTFIVMNTADSLPTELCPRVFHFATLAPEVFISRDLPPTAPWPCIKRSDERRTARNLRSRLCAEKEYVVGSQ